MLEKTLRLVCISAGLFLISTLVFAVSLVCGYMSVVNIYPILIGCSFVPALFGLIYFEFIRRGR